MMQVILHTEYLLSIHECVIIPGLGGFIGHVSPARFDESISTWLPPQKELSFNPSLFHNDGLLISSYINTYSVSYSEAFVMVEKAVLDLKKELSVKREVQFGRIGTFKYNDNGALLFSPADDLIYFSSQTYGLFPVKIPYLYELREEMPYESIVIDEGKGKGKGKDKEEEKIVKMPIDSTSEKPKSSDTIYIPLKIKHLYRIAAVAVIVLLLIFSSTPIYVDPHNNTNYAKLLGPDLKNTNVSPEESEYFISRINVSDPEAAIANEPADISEYEANDIYEQPGDVGYEAIIQNQDYGQNQEIIQNQEIPGRYYVIIGTLPSEQIAQQFLNEARQSASLPNAATIRSKGGRSYKVFAGDFDNLYDANQYLIDLKNRYKQYADAWLYLAK